MSQKLQIVDTKLLYTHSVDPDPDESQPLPFDARIKPLPALGQHQVARSLGHDADSDWEVIPDWRGQEYWIVEPGSTAVEHGVVLEAGEMPPVGASLERPLVLFKRDKAGELDEACRNAILDGFESEALGGVYRYPAKPTDQLNLAASVLDAMENADVPDWKTPFWCSFKGIWAWVPHSATQIRQVGKDAKAAVIAAQTKNSALQIDLLAATTLQEVQAITW